jgi:hypothetical protein
MHLKPPKSSSLLIKREHMGHMRQLEYQAWLHRLAHERDMFRIQRNSHRLKVAEAILNLKFLSRNNLSSAAGIIANIRKQTEKSNNNKRALRIIKDYILRNPIERRNYEFILGYL